MSAMTPDEVRAARRSVDQMLQSSALKTAEGQSQLLMSIKDMRDILEQSEDLLDHIDAMAAENEALRAQINADTDEMAADSHHAIRLELAAARVRELHKPVDMNGSFPGMGDICSVCAWEDDSYCRWPCDTIRILDGEL